MSESFALYLLGWDVTGIKMPWAGVSGTDMETLDFSTWKRENHIPDFLKLHCAHGEEKSKLYLSVFSLKLDSGDTYAEPQERRVDLSSAMENTGAMVLICEKFGIPIDPVNPKTYFVLYSFF